MSRYWTKRDKDGHCTRCGILWEDAEVEGESRHECPPGFWKSLRRAGRAVDCTGLETPQTRKGFAGSNPALSAIHASKSSAKNWVLEVYRGSDPMARAGFGLRGTCIAVDVNTETGEITVEDLPAGTQSGDLVKLYENTERCLGDLRRLGLYCATGHKKATAVRLTGQLRSITRVT